IGLAISDLAISDLANSGLAIGSAAGRAGVGGSTATAMAGRETGAGTGTAALAAAITGGAVRFTEATMMWSLISERMRASRAAAVRPPSTTPTILRSPRVSEVMRLNPEARM